MTELLEKTEMTLNAKEWSAKKKWNPFNSYKLLAQIYRWRLIKRGQPIPQPVLVTVDPINICNHRCIWCNSAYVLSKRRCALSKKTLHKLADFLTRWQGHPDWQPGVEAVCIAGGGEPLLNQHTPFFIKQLAQNNIQAGIVTNGSQIDSAIDALAQCVWVGVSLDAGTATTFSKLKNTTHKKFHEIIKNIEKLIQYANQHHTTLANNQSGYGVSYKYLLHPQNVHEIYEAAKIAKAIGCKNLHIRPAGNPWNKVHDKNFVLFSKKDLEIFREQISKARELEDENFGVYSITHKFSKDFAPCNAFKQCHAIFMTAVFMPSLSDNNDDFIMGLCCDRRGDTRFEFNPIHSMSEIEKLWGSKQHWEIFDSIKVQNCPRCTYQPHNQIFEHVIQDDSMTFRFI